MKISPLALGWIASLLIASVPPAVAGPPAAELALERMAQADCPGRAGTTEDNEPALLAILEKAKSTYPSARDRFLAGPPKKSLFAVLRNEEADSGGWGEGDIIVVERIAGGRITGRDIFGSMIEVVPEPERIVFPESQVFDWLIVHPDGTIEGNVVHDFMCGPPGAGNDARARDARKSATTPPGKSGGGWRSLVHPEAWTEPSEGVSVTRKGIQIGATLVQLPAREAVFTAILGPPTRRLSKEGRLLVWDSLGLFAYQHLDDDVIDAFSVSYSCPGYDHCPRASFPGSLVIEDAAFWRAAIPLELVKYGFTANEFTCDKRVGRYVVSVDCTTPDAGLGLFEIARSTGDD